MPEVAKPVFRAGAPTALEPQAVEAVAAEAPPDLSIVIPVHNEGENILALIDEITAVLDDGPSHEIIVIDDGSDDDTPTIMRSAIARTPALTVHRHTVRRGQSAALLTGARRARAEWIATLDGDGQNDPADLIKLLARRDGEPPGSNLQMVIGNRANRRDNFVKRLSSRIANGVRRRVLGDAAFDTGCGLKLVSRSMFFQLPHFDHFHRFLPALVLWAGGRVAAVDVNHRPRTRGRSHYGTMARLWVGLIDLGGVVWLQKRGFGLIDVVDESPEQED